MSGVPREQVVVTVAPDGAVTAETRGIKGKACLDYIAVLEDLLEATTTSSAFTEEYEQTATSTSTTTDEQEVSRELRQW